jgi:NAD(P)-dependent dehydrogenase (short-subunit alcohol dehydrogenase family)
MACRSIDINITINTIIITNCIERAETERKLIKYDDIEICELDLSDLQSVRNFALSWGSKPLHVLANNAGRCLCMKE